MSHISYFNHDFNVILTNSLQYERKDDKECKMSTVQMSGSSLTAIWKKRPISSNDYFKLVGRSKASENIETQEWNMIQRGNS